jgi:hypothetical protein
MARKPSSIIIGDSPKVPDDFKLIRGIGPSISKRLHKAGILTYNQLSSCSPLELAEKLNGVSAKQITRQNWIDQARKLEKSKTQAKSQNKERTRQTTRQHYENFTIEILQDEKNRMRRTRAVHIQSEDSESWTGWEVDRLINFIARHTGVHFPPKKSAKQENSALLQNASTNIKAVASFTEAKPFVPLLPVQQPLVEPDIRTITPGLSGPTNMNFSGLPCLKDLGFLPFGSDIPVFSLRQDRPFNARFNLDLTNVLAPSNAQIRYEAMIIFKKLGGVNYTVGQISKSVTHVECLTMVEIPCTCPYPGVYRPTILVQIFSKDVVLGLMASLKGDLLQVY